MLALSVRHAVVVVGDARHDVLQLQSIAAVQWKVDDALFVDDLADGCIDQINGLPCIARNLHHFSVRADFQVSEDRDVLVNLQNDTFLQIALKACRLYFHCVVPDWQNGKGEVAAIVCNVRRAIHRYLR